MNTKENQNTSTPIPLRWRIRGWLFRELFADEYTQLHTAIASRDYCRDLLDKIQRGAQPKVARFKLEGGLEREQIAELLAGQRGLGVIKAVEALLANKVIELSDKSTDAPHGAYATAEGTVPAFGPDERLHFAGGANAAAELLADLQDLVKPRDQEAKKETAQ